MQVYDFTRRQREVIEDLKSVEDRFRDMRIVETKIREFNLEEDEQ